jgi:hypothetical protein
MVVNRGGLRWAAAGASTRRLAISPGSLTIPSLLLKSDPGITDSRIGAEHQIGGAAGPCLRPTSPKTLDTNYRNYQ